MAEVQEILQAATAFYGSLKEPRFLENSWHVYENFDKGKAETLLSSVGFGFKDGTDINEDRCVLYDIDFKDMSGLVGFSFVKPYVFFTDCLQPYVSEKLTISLYKVVTKEVLIQKVDADVEFFSYDDDVNIFNLLFSRAIVDLSYS